MQPTDVLAPERHDMIDLMPGRAASINLSDRVEVCPARHLSLLCKSALGGVSIYPGAHGGEISGPLLGGPSFAASAGLGACPCDSFATDARAIADKTARDMPIRTGVAGKVGVESLCPGNGTQRRGARRTRRVAEPCISAVPLPISATPISDLYGVAKHTGSVAGLSLCDMSSVARFPGVIPFQAPRPGSGPTDDFHESFIAHGGMKVDGDRFRVIET